MTSTSTVVAEEKATAYARKVATGHLHLENGPRNGVGVAGSAPPLDHPEYCITAIAEEHVGNVVAAHVGL